MPEFLILSFSLWRLIARAKVKVEKPKSVCPICGSELVKLIYWGREPIVKDRDASGYKSELFVDLYDSEGRENWVEAPSGRYGGFE